MSVTLGPTPWRIARRGHGLVLRNVPGKPRRRVVMARKTTIDKLDRSFDLEFWRRVGSRGRFAAAYQMVQEFLKIRGLSERRSRLHCQAWALTASSIGRWAARLRSDRRSSQAYNAPVRSRDLRRFRGIIFSEVVDKSSGDHGEGESM